MAVREWHDQIVFLRKIVEGGTDKSYGIRVARLAGVPKPVLERAKEILRTSKIPNSLPKATSGKVLVASRTATNSRALPQRRRWIYLAGARRADYGFSHFTNHSISTCSDSGVILWPVRSWIRTAK